VSARLGRLLFRARSWTPVPLALALIALARPTPAAFALGIAVAAAGEALRLAAIRRLDSTSRGARFRASALATDGPFRFVRHPVYLGNAMIVCGLCAAARVREPWFLAVALVGFAVQYGSIMAGEEAFLAERFPDAFARYRERVPRLVPRLAPSFTPRLGAPSEPPSAAAERQGPPRRELREAIRDEYRTLQTVALLLALIGMKGLILGAS